MAVVGVFTGCIQEAPPEIRNELVQSNGNGFEEAINFGEKTGIVVMANYDPPSLATADAIRAQATV